MSDSEDDYMSSKYLEEATEYDKSHKEISYSQRRKQEIAAQKAKGYIKPRAQLEKEAREAGLNRAVGDQNNIGMKLLMNMGFKQGKGLGKEEKGRQEPIALELRTGRSGIGIEAKRKLELEKQEQEEAEKRTRIDPEEYRDMVAKRVREARTSKRLFKAVSMCEEMDKDNGIERNILWTLKPEHETEATDKEAEKSDQEDDESSEKSEEYSPSEVMELKSLPISTQLERVLAYLRTTYHFCFWCAVRYQDEKDLAENCPGLTEDDH